jgi:hypothetical protein
MSRTGEEDEVAPKFGEEGNAVNVDEISKLGATNASTLEDLKRRVEKLTVKNKKLRGKAKGKKTKGSSSHQAKKKTPHLKRRSPKRERKEEEITISLPITQCLLITIICLALPLKLPCPLAKLPILMELIIINGSIT